MREFKVGDKVWTQRHGEGIVENIDKDTSDPVYAIFPDGWDGFFFQDGRYNLDDLHPSLFHADEIPDKAPAQTLTAEATMSRRDEFAIRIACAFIPNDYKHFGFRDLPPLAVKLADALIAELDRTKKEAGQ